MTVFVFWRQFWGRSAERGVTGTGLGAGSAGSRDSDPGSRGGAGESDGGRVDRRGTELGADRRERRGTPARLLAGRLRLTEPLDTTPRTGHRPSLSEADGGTSPGGGPGRLCLRLNISQRPQMRIDPSALRGAGLNVGASRGQALSPLQTLPARAPARATASITIVRSCMRTNHAPWKCFCRSFSTSSVFFLARPVQT